MNKGNIEIKNNGIHISSLTSNVYLKGELVFTGISSEKPKELLEFVEQYNYKVVTEEVEMGFSFVHCHCEYQNEEIKITFRIGEKEEVIDVEFDARISPYYYVDKKGSESGYKEVVNQWIVMEKELYQDEFHINTIEDDNIVISMHETNFKVDFVNRIIPVVQKYRNVALSLVG